MAEIVNIIKDTDVFIEYRYIITEFYILIDGKEDKIPVERISSIQIENYYDVATFPIFRISLILEPSRYYNILKYKDTIRFKIRMQKYYVKNATQEQSLYRDAINDTFCIFMNDGNMDYEKILKDEAGTAQDLNQLEKVNNEVELFLFKDIVTKVRSSFNTILSDCNLSTAVAYLLQTAGMKKVLMSPFDNNKVYSSIVLPPQSIDKQFRYLNNTLGFHKNGTVIFFGLNQNYILNYKAGCTAWAENEVKDTSLIILESSDTRRLEGSYIRKNEQRNYYNVSPRSITMSNKTITENVIDGTAPTVIDMKGNTTTSSTSNSVVSGSENETILFNNTSNEYLGNVFAIQKKANAHIASIMLSHIDMDILNPNKAFSLVFQNNQANTANGGQYAISSVIHTFKRAGDAFNIDSMATFKKL